MFQKSLILYLMKILETEFVTGGAHDPDRQWHHKQVEREGAVAIYERYNLIDGEKEHAHYEVIIISSHNGYFIDGGKTFLPPAESYPSSNSWGQKGWTYEDKDGAFNKFSELKQKNMNTDNSNNESTSEVAVGETNTKSSNRGRPRKAFEFPTGEFLVKELAEKLNVSVPLILLKIREAGQNITVVRKESHGKGRASNVYLYKPVDVTDAVVVNPVPSEATPVEPEVLSGEEPDETETEETDSEAQAALQEA